jgi:hypothetical protein
MAARTRDVTAPAICGGGVISARARRIRGVIDTSREQTQPKHAGEPRPSGAEVRGRPTPHDDQLRGPAFVGHTDH